MSAPRPAVFDCNVFLQTMISPDGPAHACWQRVLAGEVTLYVTPFMLAEIRELPDKPKLRRLDGFTPDRVERFIEELLNAAQLVPDPAPSFAYPRDPDDAHYIDVAIATNALLVVSNDKDLLALMDDENREGYTLRAEHPTFAVLTPPQFLARLPPRPALRS